MIPKIILSDVKNIDNYFNKFKGKYIFLEGYYSEGYIYDNKNGNLRLDIDEGTHKLLTKIFTKNKIQSGNVRLLTKVIIRIFIRKKLGDIKRVDLLNSNLETIDSLSVSDSEIPKFLKEELS